MVSIFSILKLFFLFYLVVFDTSSNIYSASSKKVHAQILSTLSRDQIKQITQFSLNITKQGSLLKPLLVPRVSGTQENTKVQEFIISTLKALNFHIEQDRFRASTPLGEKEFTNIIATKNPNASRKLVLAAHFDSKYFKDGTFIGATDSSVPCAILLDIAHTLNPLLEKQSGNSIVDTFVFPTLQLIFFDGEEAFVSWTATDSLYGSRHLAEKWANTFISTSAVSISGMLNLDQKQQQQTVSVLKTIDAFVLLDLLGTKDAIIHNTHSETTFIWNRLVDIENRLVAEKISSNWMTTRMNQRQHGYFIPSGPTASSSGIDDDHRPFKERGVPIVHVIPNPFPSVWHQFSDNVDALDESVIQDFSNIFKIFVAEYLGLFMESSH